MECLTSRDNSIIKNYRKLSQSRKEREEQGLFVMEGARLCADAAASGISIETLLISPDSCRYPEQVEKLQVVAETAYSISDSLAHAISDTEHPQGIFAIGKIPPHENTLPQEGKLILLDHLQDPGNLGTMIRSAEAMGIDALILSEGCADCYSPKVIRSTMGSCFRQKIHCVTDLTDSIRHLQAAGCLCYAATLTPDAISLQSIPQAPFCGIVIGNEGNGISAEIIAQCDRRVYIPMTGKAESLNAAIAASLCMWELAGKYNA